MVTMGGDGKNDSMIIDGIAVAGACAKGSAKAVTAFYKPASVVFRQDYFPCNMYHLRAS